MDEMQILGGLLGCGVVSAVALGIIALNVSKGVAVLSQWTVDKESPETGSFFSADEMKAADERHAAQRVKMPQIGIKR